MKYLLTMVLMVLGVSVATADEYQLLRFRASWCGPCVAQKKVFDDNNLAATLKGHKVKDVYLDVDKNKNAVAAWNVKTIPCTILVRVNDQNKATVIRRIGGNKKYPQRHLNAAAYRKWVDPRSAGNSRFLPRRQATQPYRPQYVQRRYYPSRGNC